MTQAEASTGLCVNDMVVAINGKVVGGMTKVGVEIELETSGPSLLLVVSRYKYAREISKKLANSERQMLQVMDNLARDDRLLGWLEVGNAMPRHLGNEELGGHPPVTVGASSQRLSEASMEGSSKAKGWNEVTESADDWSNEDDPNAHLGCICGSIHGKGDLFWIQCSNCKSWYDVSSTCVGFTEKEAESVPNWKCTACPSTELDEKFSQPGQIDSEEGAVLDTTNESVVRVDTVNETCDRDGAIKMIFNPQTSGHANDDGILSAKRDVAERDTRAIDRLSSIPNQADKDENVAQLKKLERLNVPDVVAGSETTSQTEIQRTRKLELTALDEVGDDINTGHKVVDPLETQAAESPVHGDLLPKPSSKVTEQGHSARPRGKAPTGMEWDSTCGVWVSKGKGRHQALNPLKELEARRTLDGDLLPKSKPKLMEDGSFKRPLGPTPAGMQWDATRGVWSNKKKCKLSNDVQPQKHLKEDEMRARGSNLSRVACRGTTKAKDRGRLPRSMPKQLGGKSSLTSPIHPPRAMKCKRGEDSRSTKKLRSSHVPSSRKCHSGATTVFVAGTLVQVEPHSWAGKNCHGGVGHVKDTFVDDDGDRFYWVKYVLGGSDKDIDAEYVHAHQL